MEKVFGLIGQTLSHSFSKTYFDEKFFREGLRDYRYELFPLNTIDGIKGLIKDTRGLQGLNVTLPYKEKVINFLDEVDQAAHAIGAVNVIKVKGNKLYGFNTDADAFRETLLNWISGTAVSALILGTGGSSKAVQQALKSMDISYQTVSREKSKGDLTYEELKTGKQLQENLLVINTTPLGMSPNNTLFPPIDYELLTPAHFIYDLIYNPARTILLQKAEMRGANTKNGLEMLHVQAEKSWAIWNN